MTRDRKFYNVDGMFFYTLGLSIYMLLSNSEYISRVNR